MPKRESTVQIKQIAEKSGFSQSTVSIVLNGRGDEMRISRKTQQHIQDIAKEMTYRPNMYARRLRSATDSPSAQIIGLFWNESFADTIGFFLSGVSQQQAGGPHEYELMVKLFPAGHLHQFKDSLCSQKYSGIIIGGASSEDLAFLEGNRFDVPILLSGMTSKKFSHIYLDAYSLGMECAELFAKRGIKEAGFFGTTQAGSRSSLRELGFTTGCQRYGITVQPACRLYVDHLDAVSGYRAMKKFLKEEALPPAMFISNSAIATGAMFALREAHVRIPGDLQIIVYGYSEILAQSSPSLTMIAQPLKDSGIACMELLTTITTNNITMPISKMVQVEYFWGDSFPEKDPAVEQDAT